MANRKERRAARAKGGPHDLELSISSKRLQCGMCRAPVDHVIALVNGEGEAAPGEAYACEAHVRDLARALGAKLAEVMPENVRVEFNEQPMAPRPPRKVVGDCYFCDVQRDAYAIAKHDHEPGRFCVECITTAAIDAFVGGLANANDKMPIPLCAEHRAPLLEKARALGLSVAERGAMAGGH